MNAAMLEVDVRVIFEVPSPGRAAVLCAMSSMRGRTVM